MSDKWDNGQDITFITVKWQISSSGYRACFCYPKQPFMERKRHDIHLVKLVNSIFVTSSLVSHVLRWLGVAQPWSC